MTKWTPEEKETLARVRAIKRKIWREAKGSTYAEKSAYIQEQGWQAMIRAGHEYLVVKEPRHAS
ncbi:MAG: hypothetical protein LBM77_03995 [Spirochaetaceae bacterium]|jgi:hypothetical protein|nr:hypothetical protein [Spirochaetaceae bacterium]